MKKALILGLMILALAATGQAQGMKTALYLGGGMGMPMGPDLFKDGWGSGFSGGAGIGFKVGPSMEICASGYYNSFALDEDGMLDAILAEAGLSSPPAGLAMEVDGGEFTVFEFIGDFKYFIGPPTGGQFKPYLVGSVGTSSVKLKEADITLSYQGQSETVTMTEQSESAMIFGGGAGFQLNMGSSAGIFVEGKYMSASTEGESTSYFPIRGGLRIQMGK